MSGTFQLYHTILINAYQDNIRRCLSVITTFACFSMVVTHFNVLLYHERLGDPRLLGIGKAHSIVLISRLHKAYSRCIFRTWHPNQGFPSAQWTGEWTAILHDKEDLCMSKKSVSRIYMDKEHIPSSFDINTFKGLTDMFEYTKRRKKCPRIHVIHALYSSNTLTHSHSMPLRGMMTHTENSTID